MKIGSNTLILSTMLADVYSMSLQGIKKKRIADALTQNRDLIKAFEALGIEVEKVDDYYYNLTWENEQE